MDVPKEVLEIKKSKAEFVAKTNGYYYHIKRFKAAKGKKKWNKFKSYYVAPYVPFEGYKPLHLKNLRRAIKLFMQEKFPAFQDVNLAPDDL